MTRDALAQDLFKAYLAGGGGQSIPKWENGKELGIWMANAFRALRDNLPDADKPAVEPPSGQSYSPSTPWS
jgi:hypothetical protein